MTRWSSWGAAAAAAAVLTACGGGGGGAVPPDGSCSAASFTISADPSVAVGKAAGAALVSSCGPVTGVVWRQTAGTAVPLTAGKTPVISIEPPSAGSYSFTVDFRDAQGANRSASVTINATAAASVGVLVRSDQAVRTGARVTLRAWPAVAAGESVTWTQVSGPAVTLDASDPNRVMFTAPVVAQDSVIVLRATKQLAGGGTDSDEVRVLVEKYDQAPSDPDNTGPYLFSDMHVSRVYPYRPNGPYAAQLGRCTYESNLQYFGAGANLCTLATLPFLHQTTGGGVPTVDQVMDRVLVSHDWMGANFEAMLRAHARPDLLRLFNGVTAIVIGGYVRPSYYYALTGAIYLDANNFWMSAAERDTVSEAPDPRAGFDRELQYSTLWRYVETDPGSGLTNSIFVPFPVTSRLSRDLGYLPNEVTWLLYHELAHATDYFPPARRSNIDPNQTVWQIVGPLAQARQLLSDLLAAQAPLHSQEMFGLGQVKFFGTPPTDLQKSYTPTQVAQFFAGDGATDDYNYARRAPGQTPREDFAMLFEEFLMVRNHGWRRDFAFTDKIPEGTTRATSTSVIVRWGQRGRIGDGLVKPRAQIVVQNGLPWISTAEVAALPPPLQMRAGDSWGANLALPGPLPTGQAGIAAASGKRLTLEEETLLLMRDMTGGWRGGGGVSGHHWTPNERWIRRLDR